MKKIFLILFFVGLAISQDTKLNLNGAFLGPSESNPIPGTGRQIDQDDILFIESLKPFYHGVASGDPLQDRVIIWTRITLDTDQEPVTINWQVSTDINLNNIVASGSENTGAQTDYTVKVDVTGLQPGTTYYYQFSYDGQNSLIGRTKTLNAEGSKDRLRLAVVSCVNYQWGWFNALERIANRADLDAVIHMGDYIYEYAPDYYSHPDMGFLAHEPAKEIISQADYRLRYSQYRLDPMMIQFHQQHPIIAVWDDHESTNDSYRDGAQNHQEGEGTWEERKEIASSVYAEWMPIRYTDESNKILIYRNFKFGDLLDLYMMELRLTGKDEPVGVKSATTGTWADINTPEDLASFTDPNRKMIDENQFNWLIGGMSTSKSTWKVMGSSVMMVPFPALLNFDAWDGYYVQRETIFGSLAQAGVSNYGAISGDFHMSFATNLVMNSFDPTKEAVNVGFEFTTPSVTSANLNEQEAVPVPNPMNPEETIIINPLELRLPERSQIALGIEASVVNDQQFPWFHYANSDQHGYMVLDVTEEKIQSDWYYVESVLEKTDNESFGAGAVVMSGNPLVTITDVPAGDKENAPELAPTPEILSVELSNVLSLGINPNPAKLTTLISFVNNTPQNIKVSILDVNGKEISIVADKLFNMDFHAIPVDLSNFNSGSYIVTIESETGLISKILNIVK